jgi:hypothetical protein
MVTIAVYWIAASYVLGIGLVIDQLRRPLSEWQAAGRERRFWVALTLITGFHGMGQYVAARMPSTWCPGSARSSRRDRDRCSGA